MEGSISAVVSICKANMKSLLIPGIYAQKAFRENSWNSWTKTAGERECAQSVDKIFYSGIGKLCSLKKDSLSQ